ncbi:MAG TPA: CHAT domain-containing protein [Pyrinomonadaceae bacterium]|nr:CHAT domain-containing protein [Pyrinomonadaceae bacterium]
MSVASRAFFLSDSDIDLIMGQLLRQQFIPKAKYRICAALFLCLAASASNYVTNGVATVVGRFDQQLASQLPVFSDGEHSLKGGESQSYRITLNANQFLYALIEQKGIDLAVALFKPDGSQIVVTDSPNDRWGSEPVLLVADSAGDYRLEIRCPNPKAEAASYKIQIVAIREATQTDKGHVTGERLFEEANKLRSQPTAAAKRSSIDKFEQALPLFKAADDTYRQALTMQMLGLVHLQLSEFRSAIPFLDEGLSLSRTVPNQRLEASIETLIGGVNDVLGDTRKAEQHYERAVALARQLNNLSTEGSGLNNIGKLYSDAGDFQKALEYYLQALPRFKDQPNQRAITLNNIGVAYSNTGEFDKALEYLNQSLAILHAGSDRNAESYTLSNIGAAYRGLKKYDEALNYYGQARAIQQKTGNRAQEAETLDLTGVAYAEMGQPEKALDLHQQSLQIQRATQNVRREALSLVNLGHVYSLIGQAAKAVEQFDQSLAILHKIGDLNTAAIALEGRARAEQKLGNLSEAQKNIEESLSLIETVRAHSGSQQLRASYLASREKAYEFYVDLLMQQDASNPGKGFAAQALQTSERGRARSLIELLNEAHVDFREGVSPDLVRRERELSQLLNAKAQRQIQLTARSGSRQEIETLNREISSLEDEYQQVQVAIRKASPAYAALTQPQPLELHDIQRQLDPNTILLEYSLGDERSYVWVVTQNSLQSYQLPKRDEIQGTAKKVYDALTARSVVKPIETPAQRQDRINQADLQFKQAAADLSKQVLGPLTSELGNKRIVVVADGALQYIPFAALSVVNRQSSVAKNQPANNRLTAGDGQAYMPLVLDHEIITLPSASALAIQRRNLENRSAAPRSLAVIADPVFSTNDSRFPKAAKVNDINPAPTALDTRIIEHLSSNSTGGLSIARLPFTRQEADQILAVSPAASNLKAVDFRATRSLAISEELSKYRYVHFATHGYLDSARPDLSAIVLSLVDQQGKPQDGFLRSHDIFNLKLPAELVVLSACETGLGKDVKGEGLVGLTRGFMYAGARRVTVSLWNVNDKATATLMANLYTGILKARKTPAAALRAAQMEMMRSKQWASPYYWAAFVMQGDWK